MKIKTAFILSAAILSSTIAFGQDTTENQKLSQNKNIQVPSSNSQVNPIENHTYYNNNNSAYKNIPQFDNSIHAYRDTRLGSSSSLYNTYQKNDYGAGSVTNNPNKGSGGGAPVATDITNPPTTDSSIYNNSPKNNNSGTNTTAVKKKK